MLEQFKVAVNLPGENHKWNVLVAIGIGTFMTALDGSVINTILPILHDHFSSSIAAIEWVVSIYLLVISGLLLSFGRLGDLMGHKRIYLTGFFVFILCSALCGLSTSLVFLVVFRGIQAIGAAMLQANSPAILTGSFPNQQRGKALGLQATMTYLGLTVGPALGGWMAGQFGWRSIFYINIPVGLAAYYLSRRFITSDRNTRLGEPFDFFGAAFFFTGLFALMIALNMGGTLGWYSWPIMLSFAASVLLLGAFIRFELHQSSPLLDFSIFSNHIFTISVLSAIINYIGVNSITFLMPFYLLQGRGLAPAQAGLILTAMPIVMAIVAPLSGSLSDRVGTKNLATAGMLLLTAAIISMASIRESTDWASLIFRLSIAGIGTGVFISPNTSALMGSAPKIRKGIAAGIHATSRNFGMVLGVGFAGAIFTSTLGTSHNSASIIHAVQTSYAAAAVLVGCGVFITLFQRRKNDI